MRDVFAFINIKELCENRELPYKIVLQTVFGKKRLESAGIDDSYTARIAAIVDYNKETSKIYRITYGIILTRDKDAGSVYAVTGNKVFYGKKKYKVDISSIPYFKDIRDEFQKMIYRKDKKNKKEIEDKYVQYVTRGLESIWDTFFEKVNKDVVSSQAKLVKYSFMILYWELKELEDLTGVKISKYTKKKIPNDSVRAYIYFTIQENIQSISYHIVADDNMGVPDKFMDAINKSFDNLPLYLDTLESMTSVINVIKDIFVKLDNKQDVYNIFIPKSNAYIADISSIRKLGRAYTKLNKLIEILSDDVYDAFHVVGN